ncbi:xanthine dehydrogenase family protein molybdopterin-binding subunit [Actinomadura rugatobispora]|uniref:Xanthine dehydrogenase family protein molybdopterin-binding subunit n=1 Tax=Actinomadura rugatobispora TaxID=1994 RepID=A0ABW1A7Q5_9ACTN|nr:xanthine dehydrogenase family protein molybdopterin-binding subunit [Actinomadura rugatobispora]
MTRSADRVEGRLKVTGAAAYAADHRPAGMLHGHLVLATIGRGTIRSMDVRAAGRSPGVIGVFTPDNPLRLRPQTAMLPTFLGDSRPPLQDREVRYHGQIIGMVVARTFEEARDAATLVKVSYRARRPDVSFEGAEGEVPAPPFGRPLDRLADGVRDIGHALRASQVTVSATYTQPPKHHNAMEPHAAVAEWKDGTLTVHSGTQGPRAHAAEIAEALGLEARQVHVISPHVGGGFGGKATTWAPALLAAAAAHRLGRPVKVVSTREQLYTVTGHRPPSRQVIALGAHRDGSLNAVSNDAVTTHPFEDPARFGTMDFYKTANLHIGLRVAALDRPPSTIMRAPGAEAGSFALESAMDELAAELRVDPVELRLRNDLTHSPEHGRPFTGKHLAECYRLGAERFGWRHRPPRSVTRGDRLVGAGVATAVMHTGRDSTAAEVRFRPDGTVRVATAAADLGTGMLTVLAIVGAESLDLPRSRIRPELGDSTLPVDDASTSVYGAVGSGSTVTVAPAVRQAAEDAVQELVAHATGHEKSPFHGTPGVRYDKGRLTDGTRSLTFTSLLALTGSPGVGATSTARWDGSERFAVASFAAHFCEVHVHRLTGEARVARMLTVVDAGTIVNEKAARNQITGGVTFGIGQALLERAHVETRTGRVAGANLADYLIPVNADVPRLDVHFLEHPDTELSPSGVRGLGELGTVGSAAAIANAVYNATGRRIRDLPIIPEKLLL